jgi:hypothetical protein
MAQVASTVAPAPNQRPEHRALQPLAAARPWAEVRLVASVRRREACANTEGCELLGARKRSGDGTPSVEGLELPLRQSDRRKA